jgi:hypothetical protein
MLLKMLPKGNKLWINKMENTQSEAKKERNSPLKNATCQTGTNEALFPKL